MSKDRIIDRRATQAKYFHNNKRKVDRRDKDKLDKSVYKSIMILIPLILIIWAINLR